MTRDYLLKVTGRISPTVFQAAVVGDTGPEGFAGIVTLSRESGRMSGGDFSKVIAATGNGGYLLAYQMDENGECCYITKLKSAGEQRRVFFAPALNVCIYHTGSGGAGRSRKIPMETPWELYNASRSYEQKLTVLATVAKTDALIINGMDNLVAEMMGLFNTLQSQSYTPKLILIDSASGRPLEVFGARNGAGLLDWAATEKYIRNDDRVITALSCGPVIATRAVVVRLSDMSTKTMVDRMLKSAAPGRTNHIVDRFFNTTRRDGYPLYSPGVVVTGVGSGYEYGEKAESLGAGRTLGDILNVQR